MVEHLHFENRILFRRCVFTVSRKYTVHFLMSLIEHPLMIKPSIFSPVETGNRSGRN